jgi:nucleotide-binding universal stress UspA family protein
MQTLLVSTRITLKNILFLTDFSEPSVTALPFAAMIARAYGAKVTALHTLVPSVYTYMTPEMAASLLDAEADVAKTEMSRVEAGLMGIPRETVIERNIGIWPVLSKRLEEGDIDLIVMGTHGRTGLNKAVFGSSAEEVFRRATVPVLTIGPAVRRGGHNGGRFHCVLFATDFNAVSNTAVAYAASLAQENQSRLILLHVLPTPKPGKANKKDEFSVAEALHRVQNLLPPDAELWCRPEPMVEHGEPGARILAAADRCGADLIVLGVRGMDTLTAIATRVERATAYEVAAHAHCPVLTVRGS